MCFLIATMQWIVDSDFVNHDLLNYRCNVSGSTICDEPLRSCQYDPILSDDSSINATAKCGIEGMCYVCLHKALFPMIGSDVLMIAIFFACGVLAGAAGLGGGGLYVPILMLTSNFLVKEATPLSNAMVMGNYLAQILINVRRRHPHSKFRAMIDLDVPLMLLPAQLVGNAIGLLLAPILPATGIEILACLLLFYAATKTVITAYKTFKKETVAAALKRQELLLNRMTHESAAANGAADDGKQERLLARQLRSESSASGGAGEASVYPILAPTSDADRTNSVLLTTTAEDLQRARGAYRRKSIGKIVGLVLTWLSFLGIFVGSSNTKGGRCSAGKLEWLFSQLIVPVCAVTGTAVSLLKGGYDHVEGRLPGDVVWTRRSVVMLPLLASLVGIVSGLLGIGGGELMAPLLLAIGMLPQCASSTSAFMGLFTSCSNMAHYMIQGTLGPWSSYVYVLGLVSFLAAFTGRIIALTVVTRLSHPSVLSFLLAFALYAGLVLLVVQIVGNPIDWSVDDLCGK